MTVDFLQCSFQCSSESGVHEKMAELEVQATTFSPCQRKMKKAALHTQHDIHLFIKDDSNLETTSFGA